MRHTLLALSVLLGLTLLGCPPQTPAVPSPPRAEPEKTPDAPASASAPKVYDVACGCSIKEVGHCGNYAHVDGSYLELSDSSLGKMPFCGKKGLEAEIAGDVKDGKLVVSSFKLVE